MNAYRPDAAIRILTATVTALHGAAWVFGIVVLVGVLSLELFAGPETRQKFSIGVSTGVVLEDTTVSTAWGGSVGLKMDEAQGSLRVPIGSAPGWFRLTTYLGLGIIYVFVVRFLFQLRALFRRVRAGAPFDERNATALRWLGILLILINTMAAVYHFGLARLVLSEMSPPSVPLTASFSLDGEVIFVGLVLLALSEVFRRGARLEDEQAHVV